MTEQYKCGHERSPENTRSGGKGGSACRTCYNANMRAWRRHSTVYQDQYRGSVLAEQLSAARRKVAALENEARRRGMTELLESKAA